MYTAEQLRQDRLALLNETVKHFNSSNRSVKPRPEIWWGEACFYSPSPTSAGCAIGRLLPVELAKAIDAKHPNGIGVCNSELRNVIPFELSKLGFPFLTRLQSLHDDKKFWDENGITELGNDYVKAVITEFELG